MVQNKLRDRGKNRLSLMIRAGVFFFLFMIVNVSWAQQRPFRVYTVDDGLISNYPQQIFQDEDGFIWIGSDEGMSIYDGYRFTNYTVDKGALSNNVINYFFQKDKNQVWVIHSGSIDVFINRRFKKTLPIGMAFMMRTKDGRTLGTGQGGIYEFTGEHAHLVFPSTDYFYSLLEIGDYFIANKNPWWKTVLFDHSFNVMQSRVAYGTFLKGTNYWWYGNQVALLDTGALKRGVIKLLPPPRQLGDINNGQISYPFTDSDGFIWASSNNGVIRIDKDGNMKRFDLSGGRGSNQTHGFFEDAEGNVWVSGNGVTKFFNKNFEAFTKIDGLPSQAVACLSKDARQNIWLSQLDGISCIQQGKVYTFKYPLSIRKQISTSRIMIHGDSLWLGYSGLALFKIYFNPRPRLLLIRKWPSPFEKNRIIYSVGFYPYKDGNLLLNFDNQLFRVGKDGELRMVRDSFFFKFIVVGDELWSAPVTEGILRWKIRQVNDKLQLDRMPPKYLAGTRGMALTKDTASNIWVGTLDKGIVKFEKQINGRIVIRHYGIQEGLASSNVYNVVADHANKLYVNTNHGLCYLHTDSGAQTFENLTRKFGFFVENFSDIITTGNGDLWLGSAFGAIRLSNTHTQRNVPPKVFITKVFQHNKQDTTIEPESKSHSFSYKQNNLSFEFSATTFKNEEEVQYSFMLASNEVQSAWSQPQQIHQVSFAALSPNRYTLKVKALSVDNVWSQTPAEYSFVIRPPYYATWWFRLFIASLLIALVSTFYWYRISQLRKLLKLRAKISRDLHDEIGSALTSINILSKVSSSHIGRDSTKASQLLEKITEQSQDIQQNMSDIVWAIHPDNDKLENIAIRMREYLAQTTDAKDLTVEFRVEDKALKESLSMERRKDLFLIFKEAVNNALKYSEATKIIVLLGKENHQIKLSVKDNGIGFHAGNATSSNGLKNMKVRAKNLNGVLNIHSSPGAGTSVE